MTGDEWAFVAPYLCLMREDAPQRDYALSGIFDGRRYLARTDAPWRYLPGDFPSWTGVYQQIQCWIKAGCFELIVHDLLQIFSVALDAAAGTDLDPDPARHLPVEGAQTPSWRAAMR